MGLPHSRGTCWIHAASFPELKTTRASATARGHMAQARKAPGDSQEGGLLQGIPLARPLAFGTPSSDQTRRRWVQPELHSSPLSVGQWRCLLAPSTSFLYVNSILWRLQCPAPIKPSFKRLLTRRFACSKQPHKHCGCGTCVKYNSVLEQLVGLQSQVLRKLGILEVQDKKKLHLQPKR